MYLLQVVSCHTNANTIYRRNNIRHHLSNHPGFTKGPHCPPARGSQWTIDPEHIHEPMPRSKNSRSSAATMPSDASFKLMQPFVDRRPSIAPPILTPPLSTPARGPSPFEFGPVTIPQAHPHPFLPPSPFSIAQLSPAMSLFTQSFSPPTQVSYFSSRSRSVVSDLSSNNSLSGGFSLESTQTPSSMNMRPFDILSSPAYGLAAWQYQEIDPRNVSHIGPSQDLDSSSNILNSATGLPELSVLQFAINSNQAVALPHSTITIAQPSGLPYALPAAETSQDDELDWILYFEDGEGDVKMSS